MGKPRTVKLDRLKNKELLVEFRSLYINYAYHMQNMSLKLTPSEGPKELG